MLGNLFGKPRFLDADLEDWSFDAWAFLLRHLGGVEAMQWVTPSRTFFPASEATGHARAEHLFDTVKALMGMADWPCHLRGFERRPSHEQVSEFVFVNNPDQPNGLFWVGGGEAQIEYAADLIERPMQLTATFAHELSHYLLSTIAEEPPGGHAAHELLTELCVAYAGFGIFAANSAFEFDQHGDAFAQGWRSRRSGYLSERAWAFALAVFGALKGQPAPDGFLKPGILQMVRAAEKHLTKHPAPLDALRGMVTP